MEALGHLVSASLARHGVETAIDCRRLQWSGWFRCENSFSVLLVPGKPGIYAMAEEVVAPGELVVTGGKRMLALFDIRETEDLGIALGRMFLPGNPLLRKLLAGRCFARYAVMEDANQRAVALSALSKWMEASTEASFTGADPVVRDM